MTRPSSPECIAETARLAYHLHWPLDTILDLEHRDRRKLPRGSRRTRRRGRRGRLVRRDHRMGPRRLRWNPTTAHPTARNPRAAGARPYGWRRKPALGRDRAPGQRGGRRTGARARAARGDETEPAAPRRDDRRARRGDRAQRGRRARRRRRRPPPGARPRPVGMADWQAAWILGGDAEKAIEMSADAAVQEAANPGSTQQGGGRSRLQRSRGARIVEGRASGAPEPAPPPAPAVAREPAEPTLPPVPGADVPPASPSGPRKRVARSPAGSAHSEPVADTGKPSVQGPSIMRSARPPSLRGGEAATPASGGERPAPVRLELRRRETAPVSEPVRPRMQRAARGSVRGRLCDRSGGGHRRAGAGGEARRLPPRDRRADRPPSRPTTPRPSRRRPPRRRRR